jgi:hypothetical protein
MLSFILWFLCANTITYNYSAARLNMPLVQANVLVVWAIIFGVLAYVL